MKIAVLSGKGGTGKTLVSVNLAAVTAPSCYIDCDVEEPNGHLFFKPNHVETKEVSVLLPKVDLLLCDGCRKCVEFCQFNALAYVQSKLMIFDEICHSCGGCILVCPQKALIERKKVIGHIEEGFSEHVFVKSGFLNPGESSGVPVIKILLDSGKKGNFENTFIDCPPGSACIVMESIREADYCVLVAEPTLFGVHNLAMVHELVKLFKKPYGAILNKCLPEANPAEDYCFEQKITILGKIAFNHYLGELNAQGLIISRESEEYRELFLNIWDRIQKEVRNEATPSS